MNPKQRNYNLPISTTIFTVALVAVASLPSTAAGLFSRDRRNSSGGDDGGGRSSTASHFSRNYETANAGVAADEFYGIPLWNDFREVPVEDLLPLALLMMILLLKPRISLLSDPDWSFNKGLCFPQPIVEEGDKTLLHLALEHRNSDFVDILVGAGARADLYNDDLDLCPIQLDGPPDRVTCDRYLPQLPSRPEQDHV